MATGALVTLGSILWLAAPGADGPEARVRVAIVPFESISGIAEAGRAVTDQVALALAASGVEAIYGEPVQEFLREQRARYYDSLDAGTTERLARALDVEAVIFGQVLAWDSRANQRDPIVAISASLLSRTGEVLWGSTSAASGSEMEDSLGQGRVLELVPLARVVVRDLMKGFPVPLGKVRVEHSAGGLGLPTVHRSGVPPEGSRRILVFPIENLTEETGPAARVLEAVIQRRLAERTGLEVVTPGQMRRAIVSRSLPPPWMMTTLAIGKLANEVGAGYVLSGSILSWGWTASERGYPGWQVEIHLELTDVQAQRVVWTGVHRRNGADSTGFLKLGAISTMPAVADRVVSELLEAFTR